MTLLLWGGASGVVSITPIAFGKVAALLMPDEIPIGGTWELAMEVFDNTGSSVLDSAPQYAVYGFTAAGVRTVVAPLAAMTQVGVSNLWRAVPPTISYKGTYEVYVVGLVATVAFVATRPLTVRPKFDPFALANDDVLVSRMDQESPLSQP